MRPQPPTWFGRTPDDETRTLIFGRMDLFCFGPNPV